MYRLITIVEDLGKDLTIGAGDISVDASCIYDYLENTNLLWIDDSNGDGSLTTSPYTASGLTQGNLYGNQSGLPTDSKNASYHIVCGCINAALDLNGSTEYE